MFQIVRKYFNRLIYFQFIYMDSYFNQNKFKNLFQSNNIELIEKLCTDFGIF